MNRIETTQTFFSVRSFYLVALLAVLGLATIQIFQPFLSILVIAFILVEIFFPLYRTLRSDTGLHTTLVIFSFILAWILIPLGIIFTIINKIRAIGDGIFFSLKYRRQLMWKQWTKPEYTFISVIQGMWDTGMAIVREPSFTAILTTIMAIFALVLPVIGLGFLTISEIWNVALDVQNLVATNPEIRELPAQIIDNINAGLATYGAPGSLQLTSTDAVQLLNNSINTLSNNIGDLLGNILSSSLNLTFHAFLLIISMIYMFQMRTHMRESISNFSPLDGDLDKLFFDKFITTIRAIVKGTVFVALAQATAVSLALIVLGAEGVVLLWLIMLIASVIPVGSGIVWFPAGVGLILTGQVLPGIILIIYSALIINIIDSTLRPYIMQDSTQLNPLITLFSVLGGISVFGMIGIVYGPLIVVFFISIMHVYNEQIRPRE